MGDEDDSHTLADSNQPDQAASAAEQPDVDTVAIWAQKEDAEAALQKDRDQKSASGWKRRLSFTR